MGMCDRKTRLNKCACKGLQEPSGSRMALNFSHNTNKDLKQSGWESRQSGTAWGEPILRAEPLPDPGVLPGEPRLCECKLEDSQIHSSFITQLARALGGQAQNFLAGFKASTINT